MKQHIKIIILIVFLCNFPTEGGANHAAKLTNKLQTVFKNYYSSSFLWQTLAHYMNKSELALPGFSKMFNEFAIIDRKHAHRILELTAQYGWHLKSYDIKTRHIVNIAYNNYENATKTCKGRETHKCKNNRIRYPYCEGTPYTDLNFAFLTNTDRDTTTHLRAYDILKLTYVIDVCYMMLDLHPWNKKPHLRYTLVKEFAMEETHRRKYIRDLLEKLNKGNLLAEFILDKSLQSTPY